MKRIDTSSRALDLFGPGKDGFKDGDLANGIAPTAFNALWPNGVQEEILAVIEAAGLVPNGGDLTQLLQAIRKMGRRTLTLTAGVTNLAPTDEGVIFIDAAGGNVTVNLPSVASSLGVRFQFMRVDITANAVTIVRNSGTPADKIDFGGATVNSVAMSALREQRILFSDGGGLWRQFNEVLQRNVATNGYRQYNDGWMEQSGIATLAAVGNFNTQVVAGVTYYTNYYNVSFPVAYPNAHATTICSLAGGRFDTQGPEYGAWVRSNISTTGGANNKAGFTASVTTNNLGLIPTIHWYSRGY